MKDSAGMPMEGERVDFYLGTVWIDFAITDSNGVAKAKHQIDEAGTYQLKANYDGREYHLPCDSNTITVEVGEKTTPLDNTMYIAIGVVAVAIILIAVLFMRMRS